MSNDGKKRRRSRGKEKRSKCKWKAMKISWRTMGKLGNEKFFWLFFSWIRNEIEDSLREVEIEKQGKKEREREREWRKRTGNERPVCEYSLEQKNLFQPRSFYLSSYRYVLLLSVISYHTFTDLIIN